LQAQKLSQHHHHCRRQLPLPLVGMNSVLFAVTSDNDMG